MNRLLAREERKQDARGLQQATPGDLRVHVHEEEVHMARADACTVEASEVQRWGKVANRTVRVWHAAFESVLVNRVSGRVGCMRRGRIESGALRT